MHFGCVEYIFIHICYTKNYLQDILANHSLFLIKRRGNQIFLRYVKDDKVNNHKTL